MALGNLTVVLGAGSDELKRLGRVGSTNLAALYHHLVGIEWCLCTEDWLNSRKLGQLLATFDVRD